MGDTAPRLPTFEELARSPDDRLDVALGAALIAKDVYGALDVKGVIGRLDTLAAPLLPRRLEGRPLVAQARHLAEHIYLANGFAGNESDYYDPRNSLLPDVLERKTGIPITLGLVYVEVARRCGVVARGVGFPGHFLVRLDRPDRDEAALFIDPFFGGKILDEDAIRATLQRLTGRPDEVSRELLEPTTPRAFLVRMLLNLRGVYLQRGDFPRALLAVDRILCLSPDAPDALRDRGLLAARLGGRAQAIADLERFLELSPDASDAAALRAKLGELKATTASLN